jgi:hypothetical protein
MPRHAPAAAFTRHNHTSPPLPPPRSLLTARVDPAPPLPPAPVARPAGAPARPDTHICASTTAAGMAAAGEGEIDVGGLLSGSAEKIKVLMRRDPKFIGSLITVRAPPGVRGAPCRRRRARARPLRARACAAPHPAAPAAALNRRRFPPYIFLQQLDKHMHNMMAEKHQRQEQIRVDEEALAKLEATIATHITPNLVRPAAVGASAAARTRMLTAPRAAWWHLEHQTPCLSPRNPPRAPNPPPCRQEHLTQEVARKGAQHDALAAALEAQMGSRRDLEREVAALVSKARHTSGKLMVGPRGGGAGRRGGLGRRFWQQWRGVDGLAHAGGAAALLAGCAASGGPKPPLHRRCAPDLAPPAGQDREQPAAGVPRLLLDDANNAADMAPGQGAAGSSGRGSGRRGGGRVAAGRRRWRRLGHLIRWPCLQAPRQAARMAHSCRCSAPRNRARPDATHPLARAVCATGHCHCRSAPASRVQPTSAARWPHRYAPRSRLPRARRAGMMRAGGASAVCGREWALLSVDGTLPGGSLFSRRLWAHGGWGAVAAARQRGPPPPPPRIPWAGALTRERPDRARGRALAPAGCAGGRGSHRG